MGEAPVGGGRGEFPPQLPGGEAATRLASSARIGNGARVVSASRFTKDAGDRGFSRHLSSFKGW